VVRRLRRCFRGLSNLPHPSLVPSRSDRDGEARSLDRRAFTDVAFAGRWRLSLPSARPDRDSRFETNAARTVRQLPVGTSASSHLPNLLRRPRSVHGKPGSGRAVLSSSPTTEFTVSPTNAEVYVYGYAAQGPAAPWVRIIFAISGGIGRTAAFGTNVRTALFDVGDPQGILLNDSGECVIDRMGTPFVTADHGLEYHRGPKLIRFYGLSDDGRVRWIGDSYGPPILVDIGRAEAGAPGGVFIIIAAGLCIATMWFGRPLTLFVRFLLRRPAERNAANFIRSLDTDALIFDDPGPGANPRR